MLVAEGKKVQQKKKTVETELRSRTGQCVVDIWGGFADRESERRWREDTLQIIFSTSKSGLACLDGKISYEDAADPDRMAKFIEDSA
ncbi:hypothetical protein TELCIR_01405 [Teladorsagia circumcincta]|uniref:Beta-lactamase-related domain-containing protein n=1 Tax=Teladorsagia circumcincta TaxID=45464 RepID=A0A2G9V220_TELCI|nr:hypothetical protein TELCIR_01405 [Teladorsagia circumcincta]